MPSHRFTEPDQLLLEKIMRLRRDIRGNNFTNAPVPDASVEKILQAASWAPSVGFSQPWQFVLIRKQKIKQQVAGLFDKANNDAANQFSDQKRTEYEQLKLEGILEAPINIAVFYTPNNSPVLGQHSMPEMGEYSVVCAIQNMWLMARSLNLGIGWVSILEPESVKAVLNAPDDAKLVAYLCLGQVKKFAEIPELETKGWAERKPIEFSLYQDRFDN